MMFDESKISTGFSQGGRQRVGNASDFREVEELARGVFLLF